MSLRIETERLVLRMPCLGDAEGVAEQLTDSEVMRFLGSTVPREDVPAVIQKWLARWNENGFGPLAIERREGGGFLGRIGLLVWDTRSWTITTLQEAGEHGQVELGWALARSAWGHGYAYEAAVAVRDWIRAQGFARLISLVAPDNLRSQRLAERLGATPAETVTLFDSGPAVVWVHP